MAIRRSPTAAAAASRPVWVLITPAALSVLVAVDEEVVIPESEAVLGAPEARSETRLLALPERSEARSEARLSLSVVLEMAALVVALIHAASRLDLSSRRSDARADLLCSRSETRDPAAESLSVLRARAEAVKARSVVETRIVVGKTMGIWRVGVCYRFGKSLIVALQRSLVILMLLILKREL